MMVTKWELITDAERTVLERTPFGQPCSGCGTVLDTEADFAKHFTLIRRTGWPSTATTPVREDYYLNLGNCPEKKEEK